LKEQCETLVNVTYAKAKGGNIRLNNELPLRECFTFIKVFTNQKVIKVERNENILKDQKVALVVENQYINKKAKVVKKNNIIPYYEALILTYTKIFIYVPSSKNKKSYTYLNVEC